jgi:hypothetical protein
MSRFETTFACHRVVKPGWPLVAAVVAAFLLVPAAALPLPEAANLVRNPGAESGPGATSDTAVAPIPRWTTARGFTAVRYGTGFTGGGGAFPGAPQGGGRNFFAGGPTSATATATATQRINVAGSAGKIDAGGVTATLSALIGGYLDRADNGRVSAIFRSANGKALGRLTVGPVTPAARGNATGLIPVSGNKRVPRKTRSIEVVLLARRVTGFYNDAYFDNISLKLVG